MEFFFSSIVTILVNVLVQDRQMHLIANDQSQFSLFPSLDQVCGIEASSNCGLGIFDVDEGAMSFDRKIAGKPSPSHLLKDRLEKTVKSLRFSYSGIQD